MGGHGSEKAADALRAAPDRGRFVEHHEVLYAHQPDGGKPTLPLSGL
ncbi:hypothetical protein ABZZ79_25125 [Streptomyces sp. NPDC006458]